MSEAVKKVREKHLRYAIVTDAGNVMVKFEDILYVEGQKRKVTYHLQNNNRASYDCNESLGDVEARLGTQGFLRTYRTILVNMRHICFLNRTHLTLTDGTTQTMTEYDVLGLKYVPVKVKSSDYASFKEKYSVVENNGTLIGAMEK